ncbi:MAG: hypothetical protein IAE91_05975 [Ignavibacteriaceae bacterium]|nr:hypothetical protein [Ignavibacteriaceae bacterium]
MKRRIAFAVFLVYLGVVAAIGLLPRYNSQVDLDCELIRRSGAMLWSENLDDVPVQPDGLDVQHLREVAASCGYPRERWMTTPSPQPTATFSPNCFNEAVAYNQSGGEQNRMELAIERLLECREYFTTATP